MTDVLIIGGGPAGSVLATLAGRHGLRVELYERDTFPREKPCGEGLMPAGVDVLSRLGLVERVGGAPFLGIRYHTDGFVATGRFPSSPGGAAFGIAQRRSRLDQFLFEIAGTTPGVVARAGVPVDGLVTDTTGRVTGATVRGETRPARLVIAADGAHSRTRRYLDARVSSRRAHARVGMRAHFRVAGDRAQPPWVDVFLGRDHELYVTALPGGETLVAALAGAEALRLSPTLSANGAHRRGRALDETFSRWLGSHPALAARLEGAEQVTDVLATSPLSGRARRTVAPGIVLLGDAASFSDPVSGGGMAQALVAAELLVDYIRRCGLEDQRWLPAFDRDRRARLRDAAQLTGALVWLTRRPALAAFAVRTVARSPRLMSHLVGVAGGTRTLAGV